VAAQILGYGVYKPVHKEGEGLGRGVGCPAFGGLLITNRERGEVMCARCGLVVAGKRGG
jgi:hypothetical protein